jgi:hypothetical protein
MGSRWKSPLWGLVALLTTIPIAAVFHHAIFFRPTCMLNYFGADYHFDVILGWLRNDPSLPLAIVVAIVVWVTGIYRPQIRVWAASFVIVFIPLSIWIWDIPFTGRVICGTFHDGRTWIHTRHLYLLGIVLWIPVALLLRRQGKGMDR